MVKPLMDFHYQSESFENFKKHISNCESCKKTAVEFERQMKSIDSQIPYVSMNPQTDREFLGEISDFLDSLNREKALKKRQEKKKFMKAAGWDFLKALVSPTMIAGGGLAVAVIFILKLVNL